jgi:hypothetical protein
MSWNPDKPAPIYPPPTAEFQGNPIMSKTTPPTKLMTEYAGICWYDETTSKMYINVDGKWQFVEPTRVMKSI